MHTGFAFYHLNKCLELSAAVSASLKALMGTDILLPVPTGIYFVP